MYAVVIVIIIIIIIIIIIVPSSSYSISKDMPQQRPHWPLLLRLVLGIDLSRHSTILRQRPFVPKPLHFLPVLDCIQEVVDVDVDGLESLWPGSVSKICML